MVDAFHAWRKCAVRSVSTTGICVAIDLPLAIGARADIYFEIPRALAVEVHAEVVRCGDGELAFRFLDLSPDAAESIAMYVQSHSQEAAPSYAVVC